jgi:excisionase family DNA binding protein
MEDEKEPKMPDILTTQEAADLLGVHYNTMYRWAKTGRVPAISEKGARIRATNFKFLRTDVEKLIPTPN